MIHLTRRPTEDVHHLFVFYNNRRLQVRHPSISRKRYALRIDENELEILWGVLIEERQEEGIHTHTLPGSGATGDEHVGHLGEVSKDMIARDILTQDYHQV